MNGRELIEALHAGQRVYGTMIVSTSPHWPAAVKSAGADFVFIDTEHIAIDRTTLAWMCQTYRALGVATIVRINAPDPYQATVALDNGASGVLAPYVETPEQVQRLRGAVKLRPLKGQILEEVLNGQRELEETVRQYVDERCAGNLLFINIESAPALAALDEILAVPGIDAVQVGPHDLSCSLGIPEQYANPLFEEAIRTIIAKARAHGSAPVCILVGPRWCAGQGANDGAFGRHCPLCRCARADLTRFRGAPAMSLRRPMSS
jgi:4-hydroxy-2-oxoheptanedioate aldolase